MIEFILFNLRNSVSQYDNPHFLDNEMKSRKESSGSHSQQERRECVLERNRKEELVWGKNYFEFDFRYVCIVLFLIILKA